MNQNREDFLHDWIIDEIQGKYSKEFNEIKVNKLNEKNHDFKNLFPDIIFVPMVAFDKSKSRLGYGGGYYDRSISYLKSIEHDFVTIGLAYDDQRVEKVVHDNYDQKLNYHIIKGGIDQLVKYFAVKLGQFKIRINSILATRAIKYENKQFYKKNNSIRKRIEKITPLKKMSSSKDIANVVNFFTGDRSDYITGENIKVDGGLRLIGQEHIAELLNK